MSLGICTLVEFLPFIIGPSGHDIPTSVIVLHRSRVSLNTGMMPYLISTLIEPPVTFSAAQEERTCCMTRVCVCVCVCACVCVCVRVRVRVCVQPLTEIVVDIDGEKLSFLRWVRVQLQAYDVQRVACLICTQDRKRKAAQCC